MRARLRRYLPWLITAAAAGLYAYSLSIGGFGYTSYHGQAARALPELTAARLDTGVQISGDSLRGRPAILNVWAPSCAPCVRELPELDRLARDYDGRVQFLGLMSWGSPEEARTLAQVKGLTHLPLLGGGEAFLSALEVQTVPTTFFIRSDGTLAATQVGMRGERFFRDQADKLLSGEL